MGYEFGYHRRVLNETTVPEDNLERIETKIETMVTNEWRDLTEYDVEAIEGTDYEMYRARHRALVRQLGGDAAGW